MTFSRTSEGTEGELLAMLTEEEPTLARPPLHRHPREGERFEVRSGTLDHWLGEQAHTAVPGETAVVPPAVPTPGRYSGSEKLVAQVELRPALRFESCLEKPSTARRRREPERRTGPPPGGGPVPRVLRGVRSGSPPCSGAPPLPGEIAPDPRHGVGPFCLGYRPWYPELSPSGPYGRPTVDVSVVAACTASWAGNGPSSYSFELVGLLVLTVVPAVLAVAAAIRRGAGRRCRHTGREQEHLRVAGKQTNDALGGSDVRGISTSGTRGRDSAPRARADTLGHKRLAPGRAKRYTNTSKQPPFVLKLRFSALRVGARGTVLRGLA